MPIVSTNSSSVTNAAVQWLAAWILYGARLGHWQTWVDELPQPVVINGLAMARTSLYCHQLTACHPEQEVIFSRSSKI